MQSPDRGKSKALRIRLDYYRHVSGIDRARRLLILLGLALSVAYGVWILLPMGNAKSFARLHVSAGPLAQVHAAFENDCEKCHAHGLSSALGKNSFQLDPERRLEHQESACQNCHRVDGHWRTSLKDPSQDRDCAHCHHEHTGRTTTLTHVANQACAECHRDLLAVCAAGKLDSNELAIKDFSASTHGVLAAEGKVQFRSLLVDRGRIKFDHAQHLQPGQIDAGRRGGMRLEMLPTMVRQRLKQAGQSDTDLVVLNCASCHQLHALKTGSKHAVGSEEGRYYAPINFEAHCQACHQMTFPGQTGQMLPLPHVTSLAEYEMLLSARNESMRVQSRTEEAARETPASALREPSVAESDKTNAATKAENRVAITMDSLMQRCQQCHLPEDTTPQAIELALAGQMQPLIPSRWLASGYFDHAAHSRIENCQFCHEILGAGDNNKPVASSRPTDQEHVFIRGPESCAICHRPSEVAPSPALADDKSVQALLGQSHQPTWASDDCTLCHRYHWTTPDASPSPPPAQLGEVESSRPGEIREGAPRYAPFPFSNALKPEGASPGSPQLPAGQHSKESVFTTNPLANENAAANESPSKTGASALRLSTSLLRSAP